MNRWSMTVVRMQGMQSLRPDSDSEGRWRPEVSISFGDGGGADHTFVLGVDGRNPNLKTLVAIPESLACLTESRLVLSVQVFSRAPTKTKKKHKRGKSTPLCFALVPLLDVFGWYDPTHRPQAPSRQRVEREVALVPVNTLGRKAAVSTPRVEVPKLVLRFCPTEEEVKSSPQPQLSSAGAGPSPRGAEPEGNPGGLAESSGSSRREVDSASLSDTVVSSGGEAGPLAAQVPEGKCPAFKTGGSSRKRSVDVGDPASTSTSVPDPRLARSPREPVLDSEPADGREHATERRSWTRVAESLVNYLGPYDELREAEEQGDVRRTEIVLTRLLAEWQSVGQMLFGLAAIDAAVIGFTQGITTFAIDGFSLGAVTIGTIAAGIGLAIDALFFLLFSGADVTRFKRLTKDLYGSYFFFCLACRLPTTYMFISVLALGLFLLSAAWVHSPTIALVICGVTGVFVGSQLLACVLRIRYKKWRVRPRSRRTLSGVRLRHV